ncbi:MAG: hypothetical protein M3121_02180 [Chloroflexota bacterium]|nr:hypothetical protein [Chloroflexota bacterium]
MAQNVTTRTRHWRTGAARLTVRPETFHERLVNSAAVWLALMAYWAGTDLLIARFPPGGRSVEADGWPTHLLFTVGGLIAIWCMHRTGFPAAWDAHIPATRRLLLPALTGVVLGLLAIVMEEVTEATKILEAQLGEEFTVAFPGSLLVYSAGAIVWEMVFLLLPVPLLLWLISNVALKGRGQATTFWVLAAISSALEPALQGGQLLAESDGTLGPGVFIAYVAHAYVFNFAAAVSFRRYGLLAAVLVRLAYYLVWHIGYGNFLA